MEKGDEALLELARSLMAAGSSPELLRRLAAAVRPAVEADWAGVWTYDRRLKSLALAVEVPQGTRSPAIAGALAPGDLLAEAIERGEVLVRRGDEIVEGSLRHLGPDGERSVGEVFCVPFTLEADRTGLLELTRSRPTPADRRPGQVRILSASAVLASSAAASVARLEAGRESQMAAINRLLQLHNVSQAFHATLERDELLPIIANRIALIMEASLVRIWLAEEEGEGLECAFPAGAGETARLEPGSGHPGEAFRSGETVLIPDAAHPGEPGGAGTLPDPGAAGSVLCAPLSVDDSRLGAIEVIRPAGHPSYGPDDRDFLEELSRQAAFALRNANLLLAERKTRELHALLEVSREITSTLDIDRVLGTIVNRADSIVPTERCAILLGEGRTPELRAVSGRLDLDRKDPAMRDLELILTWAFLGGQGLYISELDGQIETDREETREKFRSHFERSGMRSFVAFPLKDEEGLLGMLSVESREPYFISAEKLEVCNILVNQATVAIRNASLYRRIPLINIMQPIAGWRARLRKIPRWKWVRNAGSAAVLSAGLVLFPWNMRIAGKVVVLPSTQSSVTTEIEGIVEAVHRREGDRVARGDLLASLVERDYRIRMEEARARYQITDREVAQYEADHDPPAARLARIRRDQSREEYELLLQELEKTRIAAPVDGVVLTPRLEQKVGSFLRKGEVFCRIADMRDVAVEVLVAETDIAPIEARQRIRVKIDAFPTRVFTGRIEIVGQKVIEEGGARFLVVRGRVDGADLPLKTGMLGRAKIEIGRRSLGYVLLRRPAGFLWRTLWTLSP